MRKIHENVKNDRKNNFDIDLKIINERIKKIHFYEKLRGKFKS
jgi:hypothetical protein